MPSLQVLEKIRKELSNLGDERNVYAQRGEEYEELPTPQEFIQAEPAINVDELLNSIDTEDSESLLDTNIESVNLEDSQTDLEAAKNFDDFLSKLSLDGQDLLSSEPAPKEIEDAQPFDDFSGSEILSSDIFDELPANDLEALPDDFSEILPVEEFTSEEMPQDIDFPTVSEGENESEALESFELPSELLSDLSDEIESMPDFSVPTQEEQETFDIPDLSDTDFSLANMQLEDFDSVSEISNIKDVEPELEAEDDFSVPEIGSNSAIDNSISLDEDSLELGEMDFTPSLETGVRGAEPSGLFFDKIEETKNDSPSQYDPSFSDFVIPADLAVTESEEVSDLDTFDGFSFDEDFLKKTIENVAGEEDFSIPGFSDFASTSTKGKLSTLSNVVAAKKNAQKEIPLEISEADLQKFLSELSYYPLNARIAVEEYLSGDAGSELHKMELVHNIIHEVPLKKIARTLENYLDRSISIPKDFVKKTAQDYEREKSSLRYIFVNKILPIAIVSSIALILISCISFLSYQFIYRPLAAENRYKKGYVALLDARYSRSIDLFDEAVRIWEKKKWYYKYAQAYREKKQYLTAELFYERILSRYRNEKQAGLEYAEMLRTDLRNFEKAETVLKRRLLDFHVNDQDGLLLLGDTYLDWAEEDASRYELALQTYTRVIELYGQKDQFLARMLRYYIRVDNLKEVLPLKDHFMSKRSKLPLSDLVELGSYFIDKRYTPKPGDNEFLRSQIQDLRTLLEKALKVDESLPEVHYNMGRYFIYNYYPRPASASLQKALFAFKNSQSMSPKRALAYVDTYRLLGELLTEDKEYLKAQGMYLDGIDLYENLKANRAIKMSEKAGKLYANFADIDYFISNDLETAYIYYSKAVSELYDNPSVQYRLGYIEYKNEDFGKALTRFNLVHAEIEKDKNLLFSYANTLFRRENYFAAQSYYEQLQEMLEAERIRKGVILPQASIEQGAFVEAYMQNTNNLGVSLERQAARLGDSKKHGRAMALFAESNRAWDTLTRNQQTMVRAKGSNLAFLNMQNMTHPNEIYEPEIYIEIAKTLENEAILQQRTDE